MSTYPGNVSLSSAVKERVISTFQQTLALYKQGRADEVVQGCGLILRMDPMFDPAKKLLEKSRNPNAAIDVDKLLPTDEPDSRLLDARSAMAGRDFQRVIDVTTELLTEDLTNDDARILNEQAREKLEAMPFVDQFIRKAETFAGQKNTTAARGELDKARALDGDHPGIRRVEEALGAAGSAAQPMSFVVEAPAGPPTRGTAQAADFGFTFEEEKQHGGGNVISGAPPKPPTAAVPPVAPPPVPHEPFGGGFSFDTPSSTPSPFGGGFSFDTPSKTAGTGDFDFSTASIETSPDDQKKIQEFLTDGDRAFDSGEYQQAIDLWSRIFLIDVTNEEASQRIEKAKARRRDVDQKVDAIVTAGIQAYERKERETARARFNEVLQLDPHNPAALDYLDRLAETVTERSAVASEGTYIPPTPPPPQRDIFADDLSMSDGSYSPLAPPDAASKAPAAKKASAKAAPAAPRAARPSMPTGVIVTVLAVVVLAAGGWFAWSRFMARPARDPAGSEAIFAQANSLAQRGKFDQAIAALQEVKPADTQHDKALQMIADLQARKSQASETVSGRPATVVYQEGLTNGKSAFDAHDYDAAKKAFDAAAQIKPLPPELQPLYDQASQQVAKLVSAKSLFKEGRFRDAITNLEQIAQTDPQNSSVKRMISDAHFNLGAQALQNEHLPEAMKEFDEVLKTSPNDELARRSRLLAERYNGQPKDLLYRMFVKYVPMRDTG